MKLNRKFEWALTETAKSLYDELMHTGMDSDLAFEIVLRILPEEDVYELE